MCSELFTSCETRQYFVRTQRVKSCSIQREECGSRKVLPAGSTDLVAMKGNGTTNELKFASSATKTIPETHLILHSSTDS